MRNRLSSNPDLSSPRDQFCGRQFFHGLGVVGWFQDESSTLHASLGQVHYMQVHFLLCGPVPNRPGLVLDCGQEVGDPWAVLSRFV